MRPGRRRPAVAALVALALAGPPGAARAQPAVSTPAATQPAGPGAEVPPEAVAAIARDLNCPLCQGYNLQDCPLLVCSQMRDLIRQRLAAGESREAIVAAFVADYGPQVLNEPPTTGVFLAAWVAPALALVVGLAVVLALLRRGARRPAGAPGAAGASSTGAAANEAYVERVERLLREDEA
jgi:cytochrome c-type biogenesis protein CcmH